MIFSILGSVFFLIAIVLLLRLTPRQVAKDLMHLITPNDSLSEKSKNLRNGKRKHKLYRAVMNFKEALASTGKEKKFMVVCSVSLVMFAAGIILALIIDNLFLMPVLSISFALIPFLYTSNALRYYEKHTKEELETALSIITTSYVRTDDIVLSVRENIPNIKPPLRAAFMAFEGDATSVSSNVKRALYHLSERIDHPVFREWCETLILCQDDRTLKDTLFPIITKLKDLRSIATEMSPILASARNEYFTMVALVIGNIPLLYLLNKDWFHALLFTTAGKIVCSICGLVILITFLFMTKYTKPLTYEK